MLLKAIVELEAAKVNSNFQQILTINDDGQVTVTINNTDLAGNSHQETSFSFWYDITPPQADVNNFTYDDYTNDATPLFTISAPDDVSDGTDKITVSISTDPVLSELTHWRESGGDWVTVDTPILINGTGETTIELGGANALFAMITDSDDNLDVPIILTFTDEALNPTEITLDNPTTLTIDMKPPRIDNPDGFTVTGNVSGTVIQESGYFNGTEDVEVLINLNEDIKDDTFQDDDLIDNITNADGSLTKVTNSQYRLLLTQGNLQEGVITVTVPTGNIFEDRAGNEGPPAAQDESERQFSFTYDITPPQADINTKRDKKINLSRPRNQNNKKFITLKRLLSSTTRQKK